jgi:hypothetical protein
MHGWGCDVNGKDEQAELERSHSIDFEESPCPAFYENILFLEPFCSTSFGLDVFCGGNNPAR